MRVQPFFDNQTWTVSYLVWDETTLDAVVIDPVLDYDPLRVRIFTESMERLLAAIRELKLHVHWSMETHAHADHISAGVRLREKLGVKLLIGKEITNVQEVFKGIFGLEELACDGRQFDRLVEDGELVEAGSLKIRVLGTPGHTPACISYLVEDMVFTGDALFMPDFGTGRCDFPNGSAAKLYDSIQKLYALPDSTRVFVGHDYGPNGRAIAWETTIGAEKHANVQLKADTDRESFVSWRAARDATLSPPALIFQSIQCNINGGALPTPRANGKQYICMPMGVFGENG
jgi:glyoxylase-like metal-dependent hydrolase (beta-lactamase superfamily II)